MCDLSLITEIGVIFLSKMRSERAGRIGVHYLKAKNQKKKKKNVEEYVVSFKIPAAQLDLERLEENWRLRLIRIGLAFENFVVLRTVNKAAPIRYIYFLTI